MTRPVYVPENKSEVLDQLAMMFLYAPTFTDEDGYFPDRNIESVFAELNAGLERISPTLGPERHLVLKQMSDEARRWFESDPRDENGGAAAGRKLILEMETLLGLKR